MDKKKKIIGIAVLAIILIGIIVVILKGFNVGLSLRAHDTLKFVFDQKYDMKDIKTICDEVLNGKTYRIRGVEVFDDAIYIESSSITEEEKEKLIEKLDNLYIEENDEVLETDETDADTEETEKYQFFSDSNIRLRDEVEPYILPISISTLVILGYTAIRFKKFNDGKVHKTLLSLIIESLVLMLTILSIIAILRIPVEKVLFNILIFIELIYLVIKFTYMEKNSKN